MQYHSILLITHQYEHGNNFLAVHIPFTNLHQNPDVLIIDEERSIGIDVVRRCIITLQQKPFQEAYKVAVFLRAETLTVEAQQALLKTLEEPPDNTQLILVTNRPYTLLPTVLSRCMQVNATQSSHQKPSLPSLYTQARSNIEHGCSIAQAISIAEQFGKTREEALQFSEALLLTLKHTMEKHPSQKTLDQIKQVITALQRLRQNVNVRLALESMLFSLGKER